jgi:Fe-S-cluster-containing hydrogenase component 2/CRP-like cAMP-binding protein
MQGRQGDARSDGLAGQWLSLEEVGALDLFKSSKRAFKAKLSGNFAPAAGQNEPGIKAAVRREYQAGEVICTAGEYGSTAFLLLEGSATATLPSTAQPGPIAGRTRSSLARFRDLFTRRRRRIGAGEPTPADFGEVSAYASLSAVRPPAPLRLGPGDVFGVDACINFYPREATVRAEERCVVLEMLRSVLDTLRDAGEAGPRVDSDYRAAAVRNQIALTGWLQELREDERDRLAAGAELLTPGDDQVHNGVVFSEADPAADVYLVRAGTIKLAQQRAGGEFIFAYLGRGTAFGFEPVLETRPPPPMQLVCVEPPAALPSVDLVGSVTLGRKAGCAVLFPHDHRSIGREHCRFQERDGDLFVSDLDSINGTLLNGERIREAIVTAGDRITVVDYTFEIVRPNVDLTAAVVQPATRLATATGLDNFEIIKLPGRELQQLAAANTAFRSALLTVAHSLGEAATAPDPGVLRELVDLNLYNSQNTLLIDLDRCTRCDECVRACADAHGGVTRFTRDGPRFGHYLVTLACRSCTDPKCMIGCPVGSIRRTGSLEIHIENWCIGCQRCANQCPFGNINMVELPAPPSAAADVPTPLRATVCDLCAGYDGPNCVYACPHDAAIRVNPSSFLSADDLR